MRIGTSYKGTVMFRPLNKFHRLTFICAPGSIALDMMKRVANDRIVLVR